MKEIVCEVCNRPYIYSKKKKNSKTRCNTCYVKSFRDRMKLRAIEYKGGKCCRCGYNLCSQAMCFHHLNPNEKDFGISTGINRSWDLIKDELDKCILLCQNCHHEFHAGVWKIEELNALH